MSDFDLSAVEWVREGCKVVEELSWLIREAKEGGVVVSAYRVDRAPCGSTSRRATGDRVTIYPNGQTEFTHEVKR